MGANVQPQGLAVQPSLAAVMPMGANVQPQGLNVAPTDTMKMTAGKIVNPIRTSYQPSQEMVMDIGADLTPGGSRHAGHGRKLAADAAAGDTAASSSSPSRGKLTIADDPLDLSNEMPNDYRNWASLLSQILLTKEGDSNAGEGAKERSPASSWACAGAWRAWPTASRCCRASTWPNRSSKPRWTAWITRATEGWAAWRACTCTRMRVCAIGGEGVGGGEEK